MNDQLNHVLHEHIADLHRCAQLVRIIDARFTRTADEITKAANELEPIAARIKALERDAERGREIAKAFLPVMEAMRPLVLNLERLKDMTE